MIKTDKGTTKIECAGIIELKLDLFCIFKSILEDDLLSKDELINEIEEAYKKVINPKSDSYVEKLFSDFLNDLNNLFDDLKGDH